MSDSSKPIDYKNEPFIKFFIEMEKVQDNPRSLVLVANGFLELMVEVLIKENCRNHKRITKDSRSYPYSSKLVLLNEMQLISDSIFTELDWFRKIRNKAAHEPFFTLPQMVPPESVDQKKDKPKSLIQQCADLVGKLWDCHDDVFKKVFLPQTYKKEAEQSACHNADKSAS